MAAEFIEADVKRDVAALAELLGDTRLRFHHRRTPFLASDELIELDQQIRQTLQEPLSTDLQLQVHRLAARLRALDPH